MADTDLVESLRGYFMETETSSPCKPLYKKEYKLFERRLEQVMAKEPDDARLWFWRGWGFQFFDGESKFEWAEHAYEQALSHKPDFAPAILALSYLHWSTAYQRTKATVIEDVKRRLMKSEEELFDLLEITDFDELHGKVEEQVRASAPYEPARALWRRINLSEFGTNLSDEHWFSGDLYVWYQLFVEMRDDIGLTPAKLSELHWGFAYGFFNYTDYSEMSPVVRHTFEAVMHYNGPPRYRADALAYLSLANSERNEENPNPKRAYAILNELLDLYERHHSDPEILDADAFVNYDGFLRDFYAGNPIFRQNNLGQCLDLFERSQEYGLIPTKWPSDVRPWAGHFYYRAGRYEDSVAQFELVLDQIKKKGEFHREYALALVRTKRVDEAIRFLEEANHAQRSDDAETLLMLLREIQAKDENNEWLVQSFGRELQNNPRSLTIAEVFDRCRADWPAYWDAFPEALQRMIVTAEYAQQLTRDAEAWDYSMLGAQWGKIAEIAFDYGFVRPFCKFVEQNGVASVKSLPGGKYREENLQWLSGPDLSLDGLKRAKQIVRIGLLWAASDDVNHPVAEMINTLGLDSDLWRNRIPGQLDAIRRVRNLFVHPDQIAEADDVARLRAILMTEGLLANLGQAMLYAQNVRW